MEYPYRLTKFRNNEKKWFGLLKNKICTCLFYVKHRWNLIFFLAGHMIESLLHKEESSLKFSAKRLNCIGEKFVPQTVCLLSEVNRYTAELSFGSSCNTLSRRAQMSTEVCIKLFTRRRIKRWDRLQCSLSISLLKFLSDYSGIESANQILARHKEIIIINNWRTNIIPG